MPSQGSLFLSDLATHFLHPCNRLSLDVARLLGKQGDANLTNNMPTPANRDMARAFSLYNRCKTRYGLCP